MMLSQATAGLQRASMNLQEGKIISVPKTLLAVAREDADYVPTRKTFQLPKLDICPTFSIWNITHPPWGVQIGKPLCEIGAISLRF